MSTPPGTPRGDREVEGLAPVWCSHFVRWDPTPAGYVPVESDASHPPLPCRDVGSLPPSCFPVQAFDPEQYPNSGPAAVRRLLRDDQ